MNWLVAQKPAGWLTTPGRFSDDPRPCLGRRLQTHVNQQIFPAHRLDFEVSGVVLFALNSRAHRLSQEWFENRMVEKTYQAFTVVGKTDNPVGEWWEWSMKLAKGKKRAYVSDHGKDSLTRACLVEKQKDRWIWRLQPVTGRPHQLRVALARFGTPILGDTLYGGPPGHLDNRIELSAVELNFARISMADRLGLPEKIQSL